MDHQQIIEELEQNAITFNALFEGTTEEAFRARTQSGKWTLLEILCHLRDEEIEDFRARVQAALENAEQLPSSIDPGAWPIERKYNEQDPMKVLDEFLQARSTSITWLNSLESPPWSNTLAHPRLGPMSAELFLANWLAHDYLHMRQILSVKYGRLRNASAHIDFRYAGEW